MGMYTALSLGVTFKEDTPDSVIRILHYMTGEWDTGEPPGLYPVTYSGKLIADAIGELPQHPLFITDRWGFMLKCDSYYFDWKTGYTLFQDDVNNEWNLTGVSNLKNYDGEISLFLDWIRPYLATFGFIGWTMYEEDEIPTLLFNEGPEITKR